MAVLGRDHLREIGREAVGVVELERILARNDRLVTPLLHTRESTLNRLEKPFLFRPRAALDVLLLRHELWIDVAHRAGDGARQLRQRRLATPEQPGVANRAPQNPP